MLTLFLLLLRENVCFMFMNNSKGDVKAEQQKTKEK
jgi:hypothetical protein